MTKFFLVSLSILVVAVLGCAGTNVSNPLADGDALDFYRLVREFAEVTTDDERRRFLDALFGVAAADGAATFEEIEQIRLVALGLKLSHAEFIEAKMRLPRERRHG